MYLSKTEKSFKALCEQFVKEQFINACPRELATYLRETDLENLAAVAKFAQKFLTAHSLKFHSLPKSHKVKFPVVKAQSEVKRGREK